MKEIKRRYVYQEDYELIMTWAKENYIRTPNNRSNFPMALSEFIKRQLK